MTSHRNTRIASCRCGQVKCEVVGKPIVTATCYCRSCQSAARQLESLPEATPIIDGDGGTPYALFRKDRLTCVSGQHLLREHRLTDTSTTRRIVAACCNTAVFMEFKGGHWLSVYNARFEPGDRPPMEMRTMTGDREVNTPFADNLPSYRSYSARFMWRLLAAWASMGFRAPRIDYVKGVIHAG